MARAAASADRGRFITLEGGEGAGKSTQARILAERLAERGLPVMLTREPGGAPGAEAVRGVLLGAGPWDGVAECMLHFAARREHVARSVGPALHAGMWVVCDRFADSTLAYQCFGQGVPRSVWEALADVALGSLRPDLTVLLDLPPEAGLARAAARGDTNRYEELDPAFHARVRAGFRTIAEAEPGRCVVADATDSPEAVSAAILAAVQSRLSPPP
ncbi:MAG: Thymidylate kinase [uncultured Acetobacteraceae bacterium]|uniref:Thymidylate kinase n=1 Tax=uncultured Acetobacteraceae bacterium TaxID=169975 RepID=A0A6J4HKV7_9PROT|nr:MAG: Thymidylate kinase [uncultured Acetobacteraceae bacterium]